MNLFSLAAPFTQLVNSLHPDDSSLAVIALLAGMAGGWWLTDWHEQLKAKRAKVERKEQVGPRKRD